MQECRILLLESRSLVRAGLRKILEDEAGAVVVGEADAPQEAIRLSGRIAPEFVFADCSTTPNESLTAIETITDRRRGVNVVALSDVDSPRLIQGAMRAGARGFVLSSAAAADLVSAITWIRSGRCYLSPDASGAILETIRSAQEGWGTLFGLTPREREVLTLSVEGLSARQIAERLGISPRTAESHRLRLMKKVGVKKSASLVRLAIREGLVDL